MSKFNLKKISSIFGKILSILSIVYLSAILFEYLKERDIILLWQQYKFAILAAIICQISALLLNSSIFWYLVSKSDSNKKILYKDTIRLYGISNISKYLPGNIFHFVKRFTMAREASISKASIATASIIEIVVTIAVGLCFGSYFLLYEKNNFVSELLFTSATPIAFIACAFIIAAIIISKNKKIRDKIALFKGSITLKRIAIVSIFSAIDYIILGASIWVLLSEELISQFEYSFLEITSSYAFSWVAGFVTPGSPGGLGVREYLMLTITGQPDAEIKGALSLALFLNRISNIVADVLFFASVKLFTEKK